MTADSGGGAPPIVDMGAYEFSRRACATDADCDDFNVCTDERCNLAVQFCEYNDNAVQCDNGNACTTNDHCSNGFCSGMALNCDDRDICTDDTCDPTSGCAHVYNTAPCDDGDACTSNDTCSGGTCVSGAAPNCDDANVCTDDSCDSETGCVYVKGGIRLTQGDTTRCGCRQRDRDTALARWWLPVP